MGMFDTVFVPCPKCGLYYPAQSKGGDCMLDTYELDDAPNDVLSDVNRHAPFKCEQCGSEFEVKIRIDARPVLITNRPNQK